MKKDTKKVILELKKLNNNIMGEVKNEKISYEQLEATVGQLLEVNHKLQEQVQRSQVGEFHQRMAYLFEIIRNASMFSEAFVQECVDTIQGVMTVKEETVVKEEVKTEE